MHGNSDFLCFSCFRDCFLILVILRQNGSILALGFHSNPRPSDWRIRSDWDHVDHMMNENYMDLWKYINLMESILWIIGRLFGSYKYGICSPGLNKKTLQRFFIQGQIAKLSFLTFTFLHFYFVTTTHVNVNHSWTDQNLRFSLLMHMDS